jgi:hypothetical protein
MPYPSVTLAQFRAALEARYESVPFWTDDQANRAIAEGLRLWNLLTGTWKVTRTVSLPPHDAYLGVSGLLTKATRVTLNGSPLGPTSLSGLDGAFRDWELASSATGPVYWAPVSLSAIAVYKPTSVATQELVISGLGAVTVPTADADTIDLGGEEMDTIAGYALHVLSFSQGAQALESTLPLYLDFYRAAAQRNAVFAASSLFRRIQGMDRTRWASPSRKDRAVDAPVLPSVGEGA